MTSRDDAPDPASVHTILSPITALLHPSSESDTEELPSKPPSPTLSMHSIHFQTSTALRGNKPELSGLSSLPLLAPLQGHHPYAAPPLSVTLGGRSPNSPGHEESINGRGEIEYRKGLYRGEACLNCRRRKIKCDGVKPLCMPCRRDGCNEDACCGKSYVGPDTRSVNRVNGNISENGITYNITHNYGTVNNVGTIEKAEFHDEDHEHFPYVSQSTPLNRSAARVSLGLPPTLNPPPIYGSQSGSPPNAFVTFSSALVRARYSSESVNVTDEETSEIVMATWGSMSYEDRVRIGEEAERADELHLAMLGSEKMTTRGQVQKDKYWSFTSRMTDFWLQKWAQAQTVVKAHFRRLGLDLLQLSMDVGPIDGVFESIFDDRIQTSFAPNSTDPKREDKRQALRRLRRSPLEGVPRASGMVGRIMDRFGKKKANEEAGINPRSGDLSP